MFKKMFFRVRIELMKWEERQSYRDAFVVIFLGALLTLIFFAVIGMLAENTLFYGVTSLVAILLFLVFPYIGEYCISMTRPVSSLRKETKILIAIWLFASILWIILSVHHYL
jgi:hypothetical protein